MRFPAIAILAFRGWPTELALIGFDSFPHIFPATPNVPPERIIDPDPDHRLAQEGVLRERSGSS